MNIWGTWFTVRGRTACYASNDGLFTYFQYTYLVFLHIFFPIFVLSWRILNIFTFSATGLNIFYNLEWKITLFFLLQKYYSRRFNLFLSFFSEANFIFYLEEGLFCYRLENKFSPFWGFTFLRYILPWPTIRGVKAMDIYFL